MPLSQITNIFEIIASIATVTTLAYLAIQIRSSNRLQRAESRRTVMSQSTNLAMTLGQSKQASEVFYRGLTSYDQLSPEEVLQFDFLLSVLAGQSELAFTDWRLGISGGEAFTAPSKHFFSMLKTTAGKNYWSKHGHGHTPEYYQYIIENVFDGIHPTKKGASNAS